MSDTEVMDEVVTESATGRKYTPLTNEQKQAATFRRDASLLRKYGNDAKAAELEAQADALAPERVQGRVDPMKVLTDAEVTTLVQHFKTTKQGLAKIAAIVSAKRLSAIAAGE